MQVTQKALGCSCTVAFPVNIVELHTAILSKLQGGIQASRGLAPYDPDGLEAEAFTCGSSGMDMIGPRAAECEQRRVLMFSGFDQVVLQFTPLVSGDIAVSKVLALDR